MPVDLKRIWFVPPANVRALVGVAPPQRRIELEWADVWPLEGDLSPDGLSRRLRAAYPKITSEAERRAINEIQTVLLKMEIGDGVITPSHLGDRYFVGSVDSEPRRLHEPAAIHRSVSWTHVVHKDTLHTSAKL